MRKVLKVFLLLGIIFIVIGGVLFGIGIATNGFLDNSEIVTTNYDIEGTYSNIKINLISSNIEFKKSTDGTTSVLCEEKEKIKHEVKAEEDILSIDEYDLYKWYEKIFRFNFKTLKVIVNLPEDIYNDIEIKNVSGDIKIDNYKFNSLNINLTSGKVLLTNVEVVNKIDIKTTSGDINLKTVNTNDISIKVTSGDVSLNSVIATNSIIINGTSGDVTLSKSDSLRIEINLTSGDVRGNILTGKNFDVSTVSGHKNYSAAIGDNGTFIIHITSGSVDITLSI